MEVIMSPIWVREQLPVIEMASEARHGQAQAGRERLCLGPREAVAPGCRCKVAAPSLIAPTRSLIAMLSVPPRAWMRSSWRIPQKFAKFARPVVAVPCNSAVRPARRRVAFADLRFVGGPHFAELVYWPFRRRPSSVDVSRSKGREKFRN